MARKRTSEFIYNIGDVVNEKVIIASARIKDKNSKRERKYYRYKCLKCKFECGKHYNIKKEEFREELWVLEDNIKKQGCACCRKSPTVIVEGLNDIKTTKPWLSKYFYNKEDIYKYLPSSNKEVEMICPDCGSRIIKNLNQVDTLGFSCTICSDGISYPEKVMTKLLLQSGLDFKTQLTNKTFDWCERYRYDFYIPSLNMIIETHGLQHYENTTWSDVEEVSRNDSKKEKLARKNGIINYIQLDCRYSDVDYIKESCFNSDLNKLINLAKINWEICDVFANKSIMMNIIDDYNSGLKISELCKKYRISDNTVREYLKNGHSQGWCKYFANKTPLLIYKDDKLVFEAESITKLRKISEKKLGVKMSDGGIYNASINNRTYKGYKIKRKE